MTTKWISVYPKMSNESFTTKWLGWNHSSSNCLPATWADLHVKTLQIKYITYITIHSNLSNSTRVISIIQSQLRKVMMMSLVVYCNSFFVFFLVAFLQVWVLWTRLCGGKLPWNFNRQSPIRSHLLRRRRAKRPWKLHESTAQNWRHSCDAYRGSGKWCTPSK